MKFLPKCTFLSVLHRKFQFKESKAFSKSTDNNIPGNLLYFVKKDTSSSNLIF